jgi:hypothetical protein
MANTPAKQISTGGGGDMAKDKAADAWMAPTIAEYEKLGAFYLGRPYNLLAGAPEPGLLLYDSKDLVTHAVCIGMTGSGKTGLCIGLIEEAALDGVPTIAIDPKGDLGNLLLTFPELRPEDFRPWVNEDDARRKNLSVDDYAAQQAELWRSGLASWGQDGERLKRLRDAAEFTLFTPGSTAGVPVSILASFAAPPPALRSDQELLLERVSFTATSLLGLLGIDADPVRSREHILLSHIFHAAWSDGRDLDLAGLIRQIQDPPIKRVGVVDLESFYPANDRHALAMALNNLLAAPAFATWLMGEPLDIGKLFFDPDGKARVSIFSIAHLSDTERMFFVSLLLSQMVSWIRTQSGTTSLRALLYMDEIFGYFPPIAEPPSKRPLLTLLKQARAYGLGVVLATQNPADLDYKGLSNTGTWFLGRLQTERDKRRVIDGLEGIGLDKAELEATLSSLGSRVFLMNNVHEEEPALFETRWALSYLRGPLTRNQIRVLMAGREAAAEDAPPAVAAAIPEPKPPEAIRPILPPGVAQHFLPVMAGEPGARLEYRPMLLASADIRFTDRKLGIDLWEERTSLAPITDGPIPVDWDRARIMSVPPSVLDADPEDGAAFAPLPAAATKATAYKTWRTDFAKWLHRNTLLTARQIGREVREAIVARIRDEYQPKIDRAMDKVRTLEQRVEVELDNRRAAQLDTVASVVGALFGRKRSRSAARRVATSKSRIDQRYEDAKRDLEKAIRDLQKLSREVEGRIKELDFEIRPTKSNIDVRQVTLVWEPHWRMDTDAGAVTPAR